MEAMEASQYFSKADLFSYFVASWRRLMEEGSLMCFSPPDRQWRKPGFLKACHGGHVMEGREEEAGAPEDPGVALPAPEGHLVALPALRQQGGEPHACGARIELGPHTLTPNI